MSFRQNSSTRIKRKIKQCLNFEYPKAQSPFVITVELPEVKMQIAESHEYRETGSSEIGEIQQLHTAVPACGCERSWHNLDRMTC